MSVAGIVLLATQTAFAAGKAKKADDEGPVCGTDKDDDDQGLTIDLGGMCVGLSGNVQATGKTTGVNEPRFGSTDTSSRSLTLKADPRIETALDTQFGKLKSAFEADWSYVSSTGFERVPNLDEASVSYLGVTVGYSDSLMNFWDGKDFQFTASAPNRSTYLVSYERSLTDEFSAAVAVEAGPPSSRGAESWRLPNTPPYYTGRLRYEKDDWTLHASAAFHELQTRAPPLLSGPLETRHGWAASVGATIPFGFIAEDDALSMQATYAVDSSIFLGTQSDVSFLAAVIPTTGPSKGWSVVGSYVHNWNDKWKSNFFVSQLELSVDVVFTQPSVKTTRAGTNLIYEVDDHWQVGVELDYVSARFDLNGAVGVINGANFSGPTGFLWVQWQF